MKKILSLFCAWIVCTSIASAATYIYGGRSTYSSDILCTWDGSYIYSGKSTYSSDIMYTYDRQYLYQGRSTYSSDVLLTIEGVLPIAVLISLL